MVEKHRSPKARRPRLVALAALVALLALGLVGAAPAWAAVPTVEAVTPSEGPEAGGTPVVIKGTGFEEPATVTFKGIAATGVKVKSPTELEATTPPGSGAAEVSVTTAGGSGGKASAYTYQPVPTVTGVSPSEGPEAGGAKAKIIGTGFTAGSTVAFEGKAATGVVFKSSTELEVTTPAGKGAAEVSVSTAGGTGGKLGAYTYVPAPTVTSISPHAGGAGGGTIVTITGTNLTNTESVRFGLVDSPEVKVVSPTEVQAKAPKHAVGTVPVSVTTPGGPSETTPADEFTFVNVPVITGVSPADGPEAGGTTVTITGSNLAGVTAVSFGSAAVTKFKVESASEIKAEAPSGTGKVHITAETSGVKSENTSADEFTYVPHPTIESVSPNEGPEAGGTPVVIKGKDLTGVIEVKFAGNPATKVEPMSATEIKAVAPAGTGTVKVTVTAAGGTGVAEAAFTYTKISVTGGGGGSTGTTTTTITPKLPLPIITAKTPVPPKFVRVPVPLVTQLHSRLVHGNKLEVRFHLAVKARVRLVARKGHKIVSQTKLLTLKGGARKLTLQLSRKRWPTKLELQTHALAALPTILQVG